MTKERITRIGATKSGSKRIPRGTLLLSFKLSLGKRTFSGCDLFTNEAIAALHVLDHDVADRDYLYWALGSIDYDRLVDRAAKGKTLNKAKLKLLEIPLPPLDEQKRIAGILDAADALRAKRREALGQLDTLLQSTFLDMFGDPVTNPMGWEQCAGWRCVACRKRRPARESNIRGKWRSLLVNAAHQARRGCLGGFRGSTSTRMRRIDSLEEVQASSW